MTQNKNLQFAKLFGLLCLILIFSGCAYPTNQNEVGVRVQTWNPIGRQGVIEKVYGEGETNFFIPFLTEWYTFSSNIQNIEMTIKPDQGDKKGRDDLLFKTIDGNDIGLDVIIRYQIIPEKAFLILKYIASNDQELRDKIVRTVSRSKPRDIFGELTTEEFYIPENRKTKAEQAREVLNGILEPYGVLIKEVLTKDYRFNPIYQKAIEDRKIADQTAEKNKSATNAAEEEYKRKLEEAIGEVNIMKADVDGEYLRGKLEADAYFQSKLQIAEAVKVEGEAEAQAIREMNDALSGEGGEIIVKMKIAEALSSKDIILLPLSGGGLDLKTTDINRLLEMYGLQKAIQPSEKPEVRTTTPAPVQELEPEEGARPE